jgi:hypothetical protein
MNVEIGRQIIICFRNNEAPQFHFWEHINRNKTFILYYHLQCVHRVLPPPPLPLGAAKADRNTVKYDISNILLIPTGIGDRCSKLSQTMSVIGLAAPLCQCELASVGPLLYSIYQSTQ